MIWYIWAPIALTGIGPLMCIHDVSANISSRMNVNCRTIYSLLKTDHFFTVPTDNGPTHTAKATQEILKVKELVIL